MCASVESGFGKIVAEFPLTGFADGLRVIVPYVGDDNDVLEYRSTAEFVDYVEIPPGDPAESTV